MELKKCPFCGSAAKPDSEDFFYEMIERNGKSAIEIFCTNPECGCQYWCFSLIHKSLDYETALNVAAERWNHRAEDEESESL